MGKILNVIPSEKKNVILSEQLKTDSDTIEVPENAINLTIDGGTVEAVTDGKN